MEYKREYRNIGFRVIFSHYRHMKGTLSFAAQPYEMLVKSEFSRNSVSYLVYGKVEKGEHLEIGFKAFTFEMTQDFHSRLGLLYETLKIEYKNTVLKKI